MTVVTKKRAYIAARLLLIVPGVIVGAMFNGWANSPSSKSVWVGNQDVSQLDQTSSTLKPISTKYFTTLLPENYKTQINTTPERKPAVLVLSHEPRSGGIQVGIVSDVLPASGLSGVADYNLRATKPDEYQPIALPGTNNSLQALFKASDRTELSAYLVDGTRYASITVTGAQNQSDLLQKRLEDTLTTWRWQE